MKVLLFIFRKCASENPKMATPIDGLECRLQFRSKDPKPYTRGLPRLSPGDQAIQSEMTSAMFKNGVIEYSDSEWSTGVVMAKKKGTTDKRYAVDYRGLNLELLGNSMGLRALRSQNLWFPLTKVCEGLQFSNVCREQRCAEYAPPYCGRQEGGASGRTCHSIAETLRPHTQQAKPECQHLRMLIHRNTTWQSKSPTIY